MRLNNFIFRGCTDHCVYKSDVLLMLKSMTREEPHRETSSLGDVQIAVSIKEIFNCKA